MRAAARGVLLCGAAVSLMAAAPDAPPVARVGSDVDTYFNKKIADPYRWMEAGGPEFDSWVKAQDAYARSVLARIPGRDGMLAHLNEVTAAIGIVPSALRVGTRLFFLRQDPGAEQAKLMARDGETGAERVLLDPERMTQNGHHVSIDQYQPSQDGRYVAVGIAEAGSEEDVLRVVDAETGALLPDTITRARFASPSWLPDGQSFFYNRLKASLPTDPPADRFAYSKVFVHHLGGDPEKDVPVFGAAVGEVKTIGAHDFPGVVAVPGTRTVLGYQVDGVSPEVSLYVAQLPEKGDTGYAWTRVTTPADGVVEATATRDTLYLRSHDGAPRYKVISVSLAKPDLKTAATVVPQSDAVITDIAAAADGLYVASRRGVASSVARVGKDGKTVAVTVPAGTVVDPGEGPRGLSADPRLPGAIVGIGTWVTPAQWFSIGGGDAPAAEDTKIAASRLTADDYVVTETTVPAKEPKVKIPLSIVEKRGTPHDKARPTLLLGYGAYGISSTPSPAFVPVIRAWVDAGGVFAVAHVRGGGELGEDWHQAGRKGTKQNSIRDFLDVGLALGKLGYAGTNTLAAIGTSAGGIVVGGAITQQASQFRAAGIRAGATNMLRFEDTEGGPANVPEFGTVKIAAEFNSLSAMDAYQHVKPGVTYPAVMLTGGANDHRVPLWMTAKMTARLQAAGKSKGPIIMRVDFDGGHGAIGAGRSQANGERADLFSFLLWQLGAKGFQPQK